jgi:hypothetical protein
MTTEMTTKRLGHAHHKDLIRRACAANPRLRVGGFWSALVAAVVAESVTGGFEIDDWSSFGSVRPMDLYAFRRLYLSEASAQLQLCGGGKKFPDAWLIEDTSMTIVVWEVCNHQHIDAAVSKWTDLWEELDGCDPWTIAVITVDSRGVCMSENEQALWRVDGPCPLDFSGDTTVTDRMNFGGVDACIDRAIQEEHARWLASTYEVSEADEAARPPVSA